MEIKLKDRKFEEAGVDVCLRFETSRGHIRYNENSPELVEKGVRRWIKKELGL